MDEKEYLFYEWLILGKGMTKEEFENLTVRQHAVLQKEYAEFQTTLHPKGEEE